MALISNNEVKIGTAKGIGRHKAHFNMPINYPRLNEFPEWFTVEPDRLYHLRMGRDELVRLGGELICGIDVSLADKTV